jgi:hypothetical protein
MLLSRSEFERPVPHPRRFCSRFGASASKLELGGLYTPRREMLYKRCACVRAVARLPANARIVAGKSVVCFVFSHGRLVLGHGRPRL